MNYRLTALRKCMAEKGFSAYLITDGDAHQSEYVPGYWRGRTWLSGFTGSNGLLAVMPDKAGLWTDGRYFIQAKSQLAGSGIALFKIGEDVTYEKWLAEHLPQGATLAFDGRTFSLSAVKQIKKTLTGKQITLDIQNDLLGDLWAERPAMPTGKAFLHEISFTGLSASEKLQAVRTEMGQTDWYLASALDSVAWLLNIRGNDIPHTPVVYAYALIGKSSAWVFIDTAKINQDLTEQLTDQGLTLRPYDEIFTFLTHINGTLRYDPEQVNIKLAEALPDKIKRDKGDIITYLKAVKNPVELQHIRHAFIKEGVVWTRLLKYLDEWAAKPDKPLYEADIAEFIQEERMKQADYIEPSFDTIAAYKENAASMHYSPIERGAEIKPDGFLLVDTGAQYLDGTTDITRTIAIGKLTDEMRRDFTLVLKGHIALAQTVFLSGTTGHQLDIIARTPLMAAGINYRCGTGHGLGYCLGVHEGPQSISTKPNATKLKAGMLLTNEPGVYKEGQYGIRTENVMLIKELFKNTDGIFMGFEVISFCPIDLRAIDYQLLTDVEIAWLNHYHNRVYDALSHYLAQDELAWLKKSI